MGEYGNGKHVVDERHRAAEIGIDLTNLICTEEGWIITIFPRLLTIESDESSGFIPDTHNGRLHRLSRG